MEEKFILDTNTWIEFFHKRHGVADHIDAIPTTRLAVSEVTIAELIFGAVNSNDYQRHIKEPQWLEGSVRSGFSTCVISIILSHWLILI